MVEYIAIDVTRDDSHSLLTDTAPKEFQAEVSATNVDLGDSSSEQRLSERKLDFCRKFPPQSKDFQEENVTP